MGLVTYFNAYSWNRFYYLFTFRTEFKQTKIFREKKIIDKTRAAGLEEMQEIRGIKKELQDEYSDLILMNYNHCGAIYTTGNEVKTYISGEKKFQDLIKDIRAAKNLYILNTTFLDLMTWERLL